MMPNAFQADSASGQPFDPRERPNWLAAPGDDGVRHLDLRPLADCGDNPIPEILRTTVGMVPGEVLILEWRSHPATLRLKLAGHGFDSYAECIATDHWRIHFRRVSAGSRCGSCG